VYCGEVFAWGSKTKAELKMLKATCGAAVCVLEEVVDAIITDARLPSFDAILILQQQSTNIFGKNIL
jgi:hypothetical protein